MQPSPSGVHEWCRGVLALLSMLLTPLKRLMSVRMCREQPQSPLHCGGHKGCVRGMTPRVGSSVSAPDRCHLSSPPCTFKRSKCNRRAPLISVSVPVARLPTVSCCRILYSSVERSFVGSSRRSTPHPAHSARHHACTTFERAGHRDSHHPLAGFLGDVEAVLRAISSHYHPGLPACPPHSPSLCCMKHADGDRSQQCSRP